MSDLQYPSWEGLVREARAERDLKKAREKVEEAETAMFLRAQELRNSNDGHVEMEAMRRAANEILRIKNEKLGWPAPSLGESGDND
jgi:hypothetical protein